jgi:Glycosyl hydrolase family 12
MVESRRRGRRDHSRYRRALPSVLAAACLATALGGCRDAEGPDLHLALVPNVTERSRSWEWTPDCRVGPRSATGCDAGGPATGESQLAGNAWNLGSNSAGSLRMAFDDAGALQVTSDLSNAPPCTDAACVAPEANTWVRGFPSVLYGIDQCNAGTSPPQSPDLQLPMRVGSLPPLISSTSYDARAEHVTHDISYDMWLNPSDTKTPCRTDGTLEVMLWTDYDDTALLPASMKVGTATIPFAVDGAAETGSEAWSVFVGNVFPNGSTAPWGGTVWLVPDAGDRVSRGSISVDLGVALHAVGAVLERNYGWHHFASTYWLDTLAFGIEFGPHEPRPYSDGPTPFIFDVSAYCVRSGTTVAAAHC